MEENALNLIEKIIKAKKEEQKFIMFGKEMPKVKKYIIDKQCGKYKIKKE